MNHLEKAAKPFEAYRDDLGPAPSSEEVKAFQKLIIREGKTSRNHNGQPVREIVSTDSVVLSRQSVKLTPPLDTKNYQNLLKSVIEKLNA